MWDEVDLGNEETLPSQTLPHRVSDFQPYLSCGVRWSWLASHISPGGGGRSWIMWLLIFPGETFKMFLRVWGYKVKPTVPWDQSFVLCRASWSRTDHWMEWSLSGLHRLTFVLKCDPAKLPFLQWYGAHLLLWRGLAKTLTIAPVANRQHVLCGRSRPCLLFTWPKCCVDTLSI